MSDLKIGDECKVGRSGNGKIRDILYQVEFINGTQAVYPSAMVAGLEDCQECRVPFPPGQLVVCVDIACHGKPIPLKLGSVYEVDYENIYQHVALKGLNGTFGVCRFVALDLSSTTMKACRKAIQ